MATNRLEILLKMVDPAITLNVLHNYFVMKLETFDRWQYGEYARHFTLFLRQEFWLLLHQND